jgi:hypothetical protein
MTSAQEVVQSITDSIKTVLNMAPSELPKTYKRAAFPAKGEPLTVEEVELKAPPAGEVLVKVEACGVCHSDVFAQSNAFGAGHLYVMWLSIFLDMRVPKWFADLPRLAF